MTDDRFDDLTKLVSKSTSRRGLLKGAAAVALGGVAARLRSGSNDAEARARVSMACARLGQPCATGTGTPGNMICCPDLTCGVDAVCCKDTNQTCVSDDDCCGSDAVCRPNPTGLGNRCLPPGDIGAECIEDSDCATGLACETTTNTCGVICGTEVCTADLICDPYTLTCVGGTGAPCVDGSDCLSGICDPYTATCLDCLPNGAICLGGGNCCSGFCFKGLFCAAPL